MLRLETLRKRYGDHEALQGLDLHIQAGEVFGFLGPNGAGKTTTIKIIAGLIRATSGKVFIDGIETTQDPVAAKSRVGYIPDRPYLYDRLTGTETMRFIADLYGIDRATADPRGQQLLDRFGIGHVNDKLTETYSHGMKQRLALAGALLHAPKVMLGDEPMVGLDPKGAKLVKQVLREEAESGAAVFLSTHSLAVAEEVCDRVAILVRGELVALGSVGDLKSKAGVDTSLEGVFLKLTEEEAEAAIHAPVAVG